MIRGLGGGIGRKKEGESMCGTSERRKGYKGGHSMRRERGTGGGGGNRKKEREGEDVGIHRARGELGMKEVIRWGERRVQEGGGALMNWLMVYRPSPPTTGCKDVRDREV